MATYDWKVARKIGKFQFGICKSTSSDGEWQRNGKIIRYRPTLSFRQEAPGVAVGWVTVGDWYTIVFGWD